MEKTLENVLDGLPDIVLLLDAEAGFVDIYGQSSPDLFFQETRIPLTRFTELLDSPKAEAFSDLLSESLAGKKTVRFDFKAGGREYESRLNPIFEGQVLVVVRDVSERNRIQRELGSMERVAALGRMAAGMSHEIRNPLAVIMASSQMLELKSSEDSKVLEAAKRITAQCRRIDEIISETLGYARQVELKKEPAQLGPLVDKALALAQLQFGPAHQMTSVQCRKEDASIPIEGELAHLSQVFINLFLNAYQAMPSGGMIRIRVFRQGPDAAVEIEDEGEGVPAESLEAIFDPFFTTKRQGSGLGLFICRRLISDHGGKIRAQAGAEKGLRVQVSLPLGAQS